MAGPARARGTEIDLAPAGAPGRWSRRWGRSRASSRSALEQLASAFPGEKLTPQLVARQFRGLGEQKVWDLCDRAFGKDLPGAIRSLRAIEEGRDDPLMVLAASRAGCAT